MDAMREIVRLKPMARFELDLSYFRHHREPIAYQWNDGAPQFGRPLLAEARSICSGRAGDRTSRSKTVIAISLARCKAMYEEAFFHLLESSSSDARNDGCRARGRLRDELGR